MINEIHFTGATVLHNEAIDQHVAIEPGFFGYNIMAFENGVHGYVKKVVVKHAMVRGTYKEALEVAYEMAVQVWTYEGVQNEKYNRI